MQTNQIDALDPPQFVFTFIIMISFHKRYFHWNKVCVFPVGGRRGQLHAATRERCGFTGRQGWARAIQAEAPGPRAAGDLWWRLVPKHAPAVGFAAGQGHQEVSGTAIYPNTNTCHRTLKCAYGYQMCHIFHFRMEGRTWYTSHRGRLWISAAAKKPTPQEIAEVESMYCQLYKKGTLARAHYRRSSSSVFTLS